MQSRYRFTTAWLPTGWHRNVMVAVDDGGDIVEIVPDDEASAVRLVHGAAIPGMPNAHSHAFQRVMAGLTERRSTAERSFWSWRDTMYEFAGRMTPELLNAVAGQLYADMLKSGYTSVCEFQYLHNKPDGRSYDDHTVMSQALIEAAANSGIGLTLLPTLYQTADFGGAPPTARQQPFVLSTEAFLELVERLRAQWSSAQVEIGVGLHSLRAVPPQSIAAVLDQARSSKAIHMHIAEQHREVEMAQQHLGCRPIEWLLQNTPIDQRWCLVHATQATHEELKAVAATGATIALCPTTEANLGDGLFDLQSWLQVDGSFAVGSDSQISLCPSEELRWLEYQARLAQQERNVLAGHDQNSTGAVLWQRACAGGARASGREIGHLKVGARADIVVLDLDSPLFIGRTADAIIDTFVFAGSNQNVRDVMVGGRWQIKEGRHVAETAITAGHQRALAKLR